jgi:hypothetical protein
MSCFGCSCIQSFENSVKECTSSVEQAVEHGLFAVRNAPKYWSERVRCVFEKVTNAPAYWGEKVQNAPAYWSDKIQKAPAFWWGRIAAAPTYWTAQMQNRVQCCLMAANTAAGINVSLMTDTIANLKGELEQAQRTADERLHALKSSQTRLHEINVQVYSLEESLAQLGDKNRELQNDVALQKEAIVGLQAEKATIEEKAQRLSSQIEELKTTKSRGHHHSKATAEKTAEAETAPAASLPPESANP